LIERSFQGLSVAVETVRIVKELIEIWLNEVCDIPIFYQSPTYVTSCNSKDKAKTVHPCFEHWGSTIGFLIRGLQNHLDSGVNLA